MWTAMRITKGALALMVGLLAGTVSAQTGPKKPVVEDPLVQFQAERGLALLYNVKFEQAARLFDQIDRRHPNHPVGPFLKALGTWWLILLDLSDTSHDAAFFRAMDEVIRRSDRLLDRDKNHFDAIFFKGAALGFRGRLKSNRGDWIEAALDGKRAMNYVLRVARKDPANADYLFGKGIYDYYADVIPERYPIARPVLAFFPDADRERGLRELTRTAREGRFIRTEAVYFLLQIYYLYEEDYQKSLEQVDWLRKRYPDNPFFHTIEGRIHARWNNWSRSQDIFLDVLERARRKQRGYNVAAVEQAYYYLGRGAMVYGDYPRALKQLHLLERITVNRRTDSYFKVWGRLRQGMVYDALGERERAVQRYREVLSMKDWADSRARARQYLDEPYRGIDY